MNLIRCEACGASNLLKDGDYFVCQFCGCKYRKEDIYVHSEGQVNIGNSNVVINNSVKPENVLTIARRAHHDQNADLAKRNYHKLLNMDPSSWEAYFYTLYYDIITCRTSKVTEKCENMASGMETALQMMFKSVIDPANRRNWMRRLAIDFMALEDKVGLRILSEAGGVSDSKYAEYIKMYVSVAVCAGLYCDILYNTFGNREVQLYYDCWYKTVNMFSMAIKLIIDKYGRWKSKDYIRQIRDLANPHIVKIRQFNPSYVKPKRL